MEKARNKRLFLFIKINRCKKIKSIDVVSLYQEFKKVGVKREKNSLFFSTYFIYIDFLFIICYNSIDIEYIPR